MCLFTHDKKPRVATHDIPVWKVLRADNSAPIVRGYVYGKGENRPEGADNGYFSDSRSMINGGWLHAFFFDQYTSEVAHKVVGLALKMINDRGHDAKVVKMYIPAGEQYYLGEDSDICSKCLVWPDEEN